MLCAFVAGEGRASGTVGGQLYGNLSRVVLVEGVSRLNFVVPGAGRDCVFRRDS